MASNDDGPKPPKNMERIGGKKNSIQGTLNEGNKAKKEGETYEQFVNKDKTTERPKAEAKIEEKKKETDKPIIGKFTEKEMKRREKDE